MKLHTKLKLDDVLASFNVAEKLSEEDRKHIGLEVVEDFEKDVLSRQDWEKRTEMSMKLALQVAEQKSFPWPNASNIKFPLITIAALQYHARSYPTLISGDTPVKCRVFGEDPHQFKQSRAERVEAHMSYQILEEDEAWESEMDKVLISQPIVGCAFKKTYYDPIAEHNISENILAKDLVVNYWTKSLDTSPRVTHVMYYTKNDVYERTARELWLDVGEEHLHAVSAVTGNLTIAKDRSQGMQRPEHTDSSTPIEVLEQHRYLDLDGDGYEEPYVVTVLKESKQLVRIAPRFFLDKVHRTSKGKILKIEPEKYFVKYPFIPSPDGGFYDLGFGTLLGPLNDSINSLINQLVDAGTMANTAGGFISRGVKLRGGNYTFAPLEWKHVDTTGDDLKKGIYPLPVREPSQVLFTLLNLLINYGERVGGAVDILVGENPGQNTPAETSRTMAEQGMKIFNGIFKRTYRSLRDEFRLQYRLNQLYLEDEVEYASDARGVGIIRAKDYLGDSGDVRPAADPTIVSDSQRVMIAHALKEAALTTPGYNRYEVEKKYLKALKVTDIDLIFPDPKGPNAVPPPPNPKVQVAQIQAEAKNAEAQLNFKLGLLKMIKEAEKTQAQVQLIEAQVMEIMAGIQTEETKQKLAALNSSIALLKERREATLGGVETMMKVYEAMKPEETKEPDIPAGPSKT